MIDAKDRYSDDYPLSDMSNLAFVGLMALVAVLAPIALICKAAVRIPGVRSSMGRIQGRF